MPRNLRAPAQAGFFEIHAGEDAARHPDGKCHRKSDRLAHACMRQARVKRWGKSPPLQAQARRHGKPHRVQGQIGDPGVARSNPAFGQEGPGYWLPRQMVLSTRKSEDKIRLTALPKSFLFSGLNHGRTTRITISINQRNRRDLRLRSVPGARGFVRGQNLRRPDAAIPRLHQPEPGVRAL